MLDQLQMFEESNYQKSMQSLSVVLAKILALRGVGLDLREVGVPLFPRQFDSSLNADLVFLSRKMLKERSPQTIAKTFGQLSKPLPTLGAIDLNGNCLIQVGFYPKIERESTLSDVLEKEVDKKYFLSKKMIKYITTEIPGQNQKPRFLEQSQPAKDQEGNQIS